MKEWVACKDGLPDSTDDVLVTDAYKNMWVGSYYSKGYWEDDHGCVVDMDDVIAWMPLPEPYKEDNDE